MVKPRSVAYFLIGLMISVSGCQTNLNGTSTSVETGFNSGSSATVNEVNAHANERPNSFEESAFSEFVYLDEDNQKLLLDWNFFPSTQYNSTAKTYTFPCDVEHEYTTSEGLNVSESVPLAEEGCTTGVVLDVSSATAEVYGLVFSFDGSLDVFANDFGFVITADGFKTSQGADIALTSNLDADLVEVLVSM